MNKPLPSQQLVLSSPDGNPFSPEVLAADYPRDSTTLEVQPAQTAVVHEVGAAAIGQDSWSAELARRQDLALQRQVEQDVSGPIPVTPNHVVAPDSTTSGAAPHSGRPIVPSHGHRPDPRRRTGAMRAARDHEAAAKQARWGR